jgi:hypothetical protein
LHAAIIQIQELERGTRTEAERHARCVDLGTRAVIGKNLIADCKRAVDPGADPFVGSARLERYSAAEIAQAGNPARRILRRESASNRDCNKECFA